MSSMLRLDTLADGAAVAEVAQWPLTRECFHWFGRERQWIAEQQVQLCRIAAPTFLESKRADWMISQFRAMGCEARLDRGGNVIAQLEPGVRKHYVAVTAHLDTVLAPRNPDEIRVDPDGTLRGPGVSDNGAGLAALLALAKALKTVRANDIAESLLFVANVGEEGEGNLNGMRYLCRQSSLAAKLRSFVVLDGPSTDQVTHKALASRRFEVVYNGSGGHSWTDFGIGNPVHALSRAVSLFTDRAVADERTPRATYNFGTVEGGSSINSIATQAKAKLDIRSESADRIEHLVELLTECVDLALQVENERSSGSRLTAKIREIGSRPGGSVAPDSQILRYIRAVDAHLGVRSRLDCASTDANIPLSLNIPAISIGAGGQGGGAHTPSEWFHPESRETGLKRILLVLLMLLAEK